jgi:cobalamin biosynthesis protein CobT
VKLAVVKSEAEDSVVKPVTNDEVEGVDEEEDDDDDGQKEEVEGVDEEEDDDDDGQEEEVEGVDEEEDDDDDGQEEESEEDDQEEEAEEDLQEKPTPSKKNKRKKNKPTKPLGHDASMQKLSKLFPKLHQIPYEHYHTTGAHAIVEVGNVVTKLIMIRDYRAFNKSSKFRGFFYVDLHVSNM